jgi:hypothetical protein
MYVSPVSWAVFSCMSVLSAEKCSVYEIIRRSDNCHCCWRRGHSGEEIFIIIKQILLHNRHVFGSVLTLYIQFLGQKPCLFRRGNSKSFLRDNLTRWILLEIKKKIIQIAVCITRITSVQGRECRANHIYPLHLHILCVNMEDFSIAYNVY